MLRSAGLIVLLLLVSQCDSIMPTAEPTLAPQVAECYVAYPDIGFKHGVTGVVISSEPITVVGCPTPSCNMNAITAGFKMWELMPGDMFIITEGPYCGHGSRHWAINAVDGGQYGWVAEFESPGDGRRIYQIAAQE